MLSVQNMSVRYGSALIVDSVSFDVAPGGWLMIVGPNGAGKSTIVGAIMQGVPYTGSVLIDGVDVKTKKPRELARYMGLLSQNYFVGYSFSVREVVTLGRYAYGSGIFSAGDKDDERHVSDAIGKCGLEALLNQSVLTLSGGELQRTFLAQLFAQDPQLLILDEPTNHLDLVYQKQVFSLIRDWINETGRSVISVVHDLSMARAYGTHALLLDKGRTMSFGPINDVLTRENLNRVYSMDVYAWMRDMLGQWQD